MPISRFVYDPWELPPEQRQTTFVGREQVLDRFLAAIREQEGRATVQHYILTGPRGIGKTTLLLVLRDRIRRDPEISAKWFCVQLREEEYYVHKQRDLWQLVLQALAVDEKLAEAQEVVDQAQEINDEEKSSALLVDGLRSICNRHGKRLVLLIDNFDHIFPNTATGEAKHRKPDSEYRAFRKRLSTEGFLMLIATSVKLFQDIYGYDKGFFHFFSPVELPELSQEEVAEMLRRLGQTDNNAEFLERLGRSKVTLQTLCVLTGGNPRLITMLYHILSQREMGEPVQALWETVAGLTPMLRQELADMPRQQSKTLDALLRLNGAAAPAEISKHSRLPLNVVTTQLGRLKAARYVALEGGGKGKKATYRVADQMFSVWYRMRYVPVARRRIELFIDFLRAWFSVEERRSLFQERWERFHQYQSRGLVGMAGKSLYEAEYYAATFDDPTERIREMQRIADAYITTRDFPSAAGLLAELSGAKVRSRAKFDSLGYSVLASRLLEKGDFEFALKNYSEALVNDPQNTEVRVLYALCLAAGEKYAEAKEQFDQILERPPQSAAQRALVLRMRGVAKSQLGDPQSEMADYTAVVELKGAPVKEVAAALVDRGLIKDQLGDPQGAIKDYTAVAELRGAPPEHAAEALANRGVTKNQLGDPAGAIADCSAVVELKDAPPETVVRALINRGRFQGQSGDSEGEIADCTRAAELKGAREKEVAQALVNRGAAKGQLGDQRGAMADFTAVVELKGAPAEQVADALFNRAISKGELGDRQGEIADYTLLVELRGTTPEQVARALLSRGLAKGELGDPQGGLADYTALVELKGATPEQAAQALVNRGVTKGELGDPEGAMADYTSAVELKDAPAEMIARALAFRGEIHFHHHQYDQALRDFNLSLKTSGLPDEVRIATVFYRGMAHVELGNLKQALADCAKSSQSGMMPFVHRGLRSIVILLLSDERVVEALTWVRRFHELEPSDVPLETRLEARLDMIRAASGVASLDDASRLVDVLLEADPEELRARLQFLKPGLELARTHDESVLANLPEDERKIAKEIARSLAESAPESKGQPPS
ncbi:MAG: AAA family ATPase [Terriglobia bacterium]|jgi:tetratricopeptide (TPR) repeat protein